ncbi:TPA: hypothetical protein HA278_06345 [Candidatus Woesearchaeota archaeon]|nr:hypothetical protein [Candidatus Woesearchaeota archaeon]|tara:strand:+ start:235 stop:447 length:213 start_codon:yes stop_codon:yes gene_type:complete
MVIAQQTKSENCDDEREMLYENLKEYMLRTSVIFALTLTEEKKIDTEEAYDKLYKVWDDYFESARNIFKE